MKIVHSFDEIQYDGNCVVTVGAFDGVHLAHREIIHDVVDRARRRNGKAVVITFDPHPKEVAASAKGPVQLLTTMEEREDHLRALGINLLVVVDFTYAFSRMPAREFYERYLVHRLGVREVVVGFDHMFGRDREAGIDLLVELGKEFGFSLVTVEPCSADGEVVSSTRIRRALTEGRVEHARALLGYPYTLTGIVVEGDKRGRTLGFPTANLEPEHPKKLVPARGVYAVGATVDSREFAGMMNIGFRPTVTEANQLILEVHLLDFSEEIYGSRMTVKFISRLRDEQKFATLGDLVLQLHRDREAARGVVEINNRL